MSDNLIIDWGNTRVKAAHFLDGVLQKQSAAPDIDEKWLTNFLPDFRNKKILFCTVSAHSASMEIFLKKHSGAFLKLTHETPIPVELDYQTPNTLGYDRLANAIAAIGLCNTAYALAIDVGTCLKFDLIHRKKGYLGGAISPGLRMRYRALHRDTNALPLIEEVAIPALIGKDTHGSIHSGAINGMAAEIDGIIARYQKQCSSLSVFLTGGDAYVFEKALKNHIFANSFLTLIGLNDILEFNQNA